ncbi:MAG: tRNA (adenosine(37)-N6)-threonylcarbamoyltransferase complex ATPase subunit type 1 TsaE [Flavobacteriaceae bacterium]|nr:tRNA (adenosine(37)-N6)-threonylcarbamoyltransferase complex ATPase subunit type 1 TsaE [Flavobacteriaceae bacterium]MDG1791971.1 tRNA (adenosine(37)-N6)-threonylcarbamoyltransferase complex ATPase subunit type 1 TsaE [Flavobacteriaceae bacterium]
MHIKIEIILELNYGIEKIKEASDFILKNISGKILLVCGEVGSGKTTLVKEICKQLKVKDQVSSPTYTLINEYSCDDGLVIHMDLYRVENKEEINNLGLFEYLDNKFIIIEWPELIMNDLDINHSILKIDFIDTDNRKINLINISS